jgi:hypothetical protein
VHDARQVAQLAAGLSGMALEAPQHHQQLPAYVQQRQAVLPLAQQLLTQPPQQPPRPSSSRRSCTATAVLRLLLRRPAPPTTARPRWLRLRRWRRATPRARRAT